MVLFEVAAITNLIWAIVVAVGSHGQPEAGVKVARLYLVSSVGFLLYISFIVFDNKERYRL